MTGYFEANIKPQNDLLGHMLGIKMIPVRRVFGRADITVAILEDGIIVDCNHAGAELTEVDSLEFDADSGCFAPTGTDYMNVCNRCGMQNAPSTEEWV